MVINHGCSLRLLNSDLLVTRDTGNVLANFGGNAGFLLLTLTRASQ